MTAALIGDQPCGVDQIRRSAFEMQKLVASATAWSTSDFPGIPDSFALERVSALRTRSASRRFATCVEWCSLWPVGYMCHMIRTAMKGTMQTCPQVIVPEALARPQEHTPSDYSRRPLPPRSGDGPARFCSKPQCLRLSVPLRSGGRTVTDRPHEEDKRGF